LLRDFKIFFEKSLSQTFSGKVYIGDIKGGVFYPIVFSDIAIYASSDEKYKLFESKEVRINYSLVDLVFNRKKEIFKVALISPKFYILPGEVYKDSSFIDKSIIAAQEMKRMLFDIIDGSVIQYEAKEPFITGARVSGTLLDDSVNLKNAALNVYGVPLEITGEAKSLYSDSPVFDVNMKLENSYAEVITHISGPFNRLSAKGNFKTASGIETNFSGSCEFNNGNFNLRDIALGDAVKIEEGKIDLSKKEFQFKILSQWGESGEIVLGGVFSSWPKLSLYTELKHWHMGGLDIATNITMNAELDNSKTKIPILTGVINTEKTIINYKPCKELSLQFALRKKVFEILGLKWGKSFRLVGKIELIEPHNIELVALLDGTKLDELVSYIGENIASVISGTVNGKLEVEGPLANPTSKGHITARVGKIGDIYYENAVIHLLGKGPMITIGDSRIYKETGYLLLGGELDLRKLGKRNIFEDMVVKTDDQTIVWEGWDITREPAGDQVSLKKKVNEDVEVGFKAPLAEGDRDWQESNNKGEIELQYKIKGNQNLKMQLKGEEEFLGVERKIKF